MRHRLIEDIGMTEEKKSLYCVCRKPYDSDSNPFMIMCDACEEWYHGYCIEVTESDAEVFESYHCSSCTPKVGPSILKTDIQQVKEEDSETISVSAKRTTALIRRLKRRPYPPDSESPLVRLSGPELTMEHFAKNGFSRPILIEQTDGLEMKVPPSTIKLEEIEQLVGGSATMLDAIDVLEQVNRKMSFGEFIRYWYSPTRGDKIYNVISLEVSATPLSELIEAPRVVRQMSWVDLFWPVDRLDKVLRRVADTDPSKADQTKADPSNRDTPVDTVTQSKATNADVTSIQPAEGSRQFVVFEEDSVTEDDDDDETEAVRLSVDDPNYAILETGNNRSPGAKEESATEESDDDDKPILAKPRVTKYCLMSAKGSFTDFHVDFGGTSVWYHVLRGEKVFYLIPPTKHSTRLYERWMCTEPNPTQRDIFLCDQVRACYRVVLKQGQTVLLPSGWIHAVYTPADSLVFGGNFLHFFSAAKQIRVYEMEKRLHTPAKFMFPNFQTAHWYAASALRDQLFDRISVRESIADYLVDAALNICEALRNWTSTKQVFKLNRQFIPESMDYRDVLKELEHLVTQSKRSLGSHATVNNQKHLPDQATTSLRSGHKVSKRKADDDDASLSFTSDDDSDASSITAKRRRHAPTASARAKQKSKTLQQPTSRTSLATSSAKISSASSSAQRHAIPCSVKPHDAPITVKKQPDALPKQTGLNEKRAISTTTSAKAQAKSPLARNMDIWKDLFKVNTGKERPSSKCDLPKTVNSTSTDKKPAISDKYNSQHSEKHRDQQRVLPIVTTNHVSSSKQLEDASFSRSSSTTSVDHSPTVAVSSKCGAVAFRARPDTAADSTAQKAKLTPSSSFASTSGLSTSDVSIAKLKTCLETGVTKSGTTLPERSPSFVSKRIGDKAMEFNIDDSAHKYTSQSCYKSESKKDSMKKRQPVEVETATKSTLVKPQQDRIATKLIADSDAVDVQSQLKDNETVVWANRGHTNVNATDT